MILKSADQLTILSITLTPAYQVTSCIYKFWGLGHGHPGGGVSFCLQTMHGGHMIAHGGHKNGEGLCVVPFKMCSSFWEVTGLN